jgi:two-component system, OmpR family, KDP operon response regulator KdpE
MKHHRALVVDDDRLVRFFLRGPLEEAGYRVIEAGTGAAAFQALKRRPHLILLDVRLPDADGLDLLPLILRTLPLAQVLVMTSHASPGIRAAALRHGASGFLPKPFQSTEIASRLRRLAEGSGPPRGKADAGAGRPSRRVEPAKPGAAPGL